MKSAQVRLKPTSSIETECQKLKKIAPNLVLMFGTHEVFSPNGQAAQVAKEFQASKETLVIGCSTAGEISNNGVFDNSLIVTAANFERPDFRPVFETINGMSDTFEAGKRLAAQLDRKDLKAIFLLGQGLDINGSALIEGIRGVVGKDVVLTGGLAGDGGRFKQTFTLLNGEIRDNRVVGFGIYGEQIGVAFGSQGGWETFGPVRRVTKASQNVMYELDGEPALDIYKKYLGEKAKDLPASGLMYPFALLKDNQDDSGIIRTIMAVDETAKSVTFAGEIPQGSLVRLMHATNDNLVHGAKQAAEHTSDLMPGEEPSQGLGILISCVGRKLVMGTDIEEELEAVQEVLGGSTVTGFYSYGEICPQSGFSECKLHNQTMTITYLYEKKKKAA